MFDYLFLLLKGVLWNYLTYILSIQGKGKAKFLKNPIHIFKEFNCDLPRVLHH